MSKTTPCDYGEACRVYCGLGVDESEPEDFMEDEEPMDDRMDMSRCYSPSAPWYAPWHEGE